MRRETVLNPAYTSPWCICLNPLVTPCSVGEKVLNENIWKMATSEYFFSFGRKLRFSAVIYVSNANYTIFHVKKNRRRNSWVTRVGNERGDAGRGQRDTDRQTKQLQQHSPSCTCARRHPHPDILWLLSPPTLAFPSTVFTLYFAFKINISPFLFLRIFLTLKGAFG